RPARAIVDLRMPGKSGIELISELIVIDPEMQILVLTGYGSIATAVEAVRRGAIDYLSKPVDTEQILAVFKREREDETASGLTASPVQGESPPSLARVEYEHIQRILSDCGGNISEAARRLGIHRRSLQRKLSKLPPLE
ncbi:MAG: response regulator, partial [Tepidisphaeraceae bacterium]